MAELPMQQYTASLGTCPVCHTDLEATFTVRIDARLNAPIAGAVPTAVSVDVTPNVVKMFLSHDCDRVSAERSMAGIVDTLIGSA